MLDEEVEEGVFAFDWCARAIISRAALWHSLPRRRQTLTLTLTPHRFTPSNEKSSRKRQTSPCPPAAHQVTKRTVNLVREESSNDNFRDEEI